MLAVQRFDEVAPVPVPETLGPRVALHLLNRAGYGPRPGQIASVLDQGPTKWIEEQLEPGADPELDTRLARYPTIAYPTSQVLNLYNADNRTIGVILDEFFSAQGGAGGPREEPAPGSAGRLLVQPLQRLRQRRLRPLLDLVLRARRGPAARAGPLPRAAGRRDAAPGDALLPRQLPEHGPAAAGRPDRRRHQREPRPRAARAAHASGSTRATRRRTWSRPRAA